MVVRIWSCRPGVKNACEDNCEISSMFFGRVGIISKLNNWSQVTLMSIIGS